MFVTEVEVALNQSHIWRCSFHRSCSFAGCRCGGQIFRHCVVVERLLYTL